MTLYFEYVKKAFQERYAYRFNFFITIISSLMLVFIQLNIWSALLRDRDAPPASVTLRDMLNYVIVSTLIAGMTQSNVARKIGEKVDSGAIASDFLRPVRFKYYLWAEDLGTNSFQLIFISLPTCLIAASLYGFSPPSDVRMAVLFVFSALLGVVISFYVNYIVGLFAFWLHTSWFIPWFLTAFNQLFSGALVPLWYYPDWLYSASSMLPFRLITFDPISIYLGKITIKEASYVLLSQSGWIVFLVLIERWMWANVQRKVIVHGG